MRSVIVNVNQGHYHQEVDQRLVDWNYYCSLAQVSPIFCPLNVVSNHSSDLNLHPLHCTHGEIISIVTAATFIDWNSIKNFDHMSFSGFADQLSSTTSLLTECPLQEHPSHSHCLALSFTGPSLRKHSLISNLNLVAEILARSVSRIQTEMTVSDMGQIFQTIDQHMESVPIRIRAYCSVQDLHNDSLEEVASQIRRHSVAGIGSQVCLNMKMTFLFKLL